MSGIESRSKVPAWVWPAAAAAAILMLFAGLNYKVYDGYFQDDELDNISWAPLKVGTAEVVTSLATPLFATDNFRPPGHLYFALAGSAFGLDFPPYMTPILLIHVLNCLLLYLLLRRMELGRWHALAGSAFFLLSVSAMDTYWKPMYVFDLLCTTFSLLTVLLWTRRQFVLCFLTYWLAYKSKELAVMLPPVLLAYEYWLGKRKYLPLVPFFLASLSFGLQGILLNPNKNNDYTFRFTLAALRITVPFYSARFLTLPGSGALLVPLVLVRDRRVWFGLAGLGCMIFTLLFLPGRLFEAYVYLPMAFGTVAMASAATRLKPVYLLAVLLVWLPWNVKNLRGEQRAKLALDDQAAPFVEAIQTWSAAHPAVTTLIYDGVPAGFHNWGVTAAWNLGHRSLGLQALYRDTPEAAEALRRNQVAFGTWDSGQHRLSIQIHSPER